MIEFQPSAWARGSYLNVGCMWLWGVNDSIAFHEGYRVQPFSGFLDRFQFEPEATRLAKRAAKEVKRYRAQFASASRLSDFYGSRWTAKLTDWKVFHAGVASAIAGRSKESIRYFDRFLAIENKVSEWLPIAQADAEQLRQLAIDPVRFREQIAERIRRKRAALKLPSIDAFDFDGVKQP
ncbi:MAG: hypothetical protein NTW19_22060 [Planctomycetota bacterium]|nr:hypothetical protein [Planctomycetota bacterium]